MRTNRAARALPLLAVLALVAGGCSNGQASPAAAAADCSTATSGQACVPGTTPAATSRARLPRLVDVGAGKCIPCKAMAPILAQLRTDFAGRLDVEFVDIWVNPAAGEPYAIRVMPTQIFYAADGRELSRHEGFMSREEILGRWQSHGLSF